MSRNVKISYDAGIDSQEGQALALHRNENLFIDAEWLQKLAIETAGQLKYYKYPESFSSHLRQQLAEVHQIDPMRIYVGNGADGVLADLFHYLRGKHEEIGTLDPTYRVYPYLSERYGYKQINVTERIPSLCVIDSPNSITGEVCSLDRFSSSFLIWDNVYGEFAETIVKKQNFSPDVIVRSFSKFYGLANLRVGYCFADPALVAELDRRKDVFNVNGMAQALACRLLQETPYFTSLVPIIQEGRKILKDGLETLGFKVSDSQANFVWITHPELSAQKLQEELLRHNILVRRFSTFSLENYLRITVPTNPQIIRLINHIRQIFEVVYV